MPERESKAEVPKETVMEQVIYLMGQEAVIQYVEHGEDCAMYGIPTRIESTKVNKDNTRSLVVWEPFSSRSWYVPMSIITEIRAGG